MTNSTLSRSLIAASFVSTMMVLSLGANQANAATNLQQCTGGDRTKVVACCNNAIKSGMPLWMKQADENCKSVVTCGSFSGGRRCYVKWKYAETRRSGELEEQQSNERELKAK